MPDRSRACRVSGLLPVAPAVLVLAVLTAAITSGCAAAQIAAEPPAPRSPARAVTSTVPSTSTSTTTTTSTTSTTTTTTLPPTTTKPPPPARSQPASPPRSGNRVLVIGDSVLLGARSALPASMPGWSVTVDAVESRNISAFAGVLANNGGAAPFRAVVIHLCTNYSKGGGFGRSLDRAMTALAGVPRIVWVTCTEWSSGQPEANALIRSAPQRYANVAIADWAVISGTPGYTWNDGIHLRPEGQRAAAATVAAAVGPP